MTIVSSSLDDGSQLLPPGVDDAGGFTAAQQLVLRFLATKKSGHTRAAYGADLGVHVPRPGVTDPGKATKRPLSPSWLDWCDHMGVDPLAAAEEHASVWALRMQSAGLSPATRARRLSTVSSWYTWLTRHGLAEGNPVEFLDRPFVDPDVSKTPGLTLKQAIALLSYADRATTPAALRNAALAYLFIFTGARVSEVTGANEDKLGTDRGHRVVWITGKGGGEYPLVIPPVAGNRLDAYLASRADRPQVLPALPGQVAPSTAATRPLIATASGVRLRNGEAWVIMRQLARGAGLPEDLARRIGPHAGRHAFATLALDAGVSLVDLQDAMRHKDPRTTRRYDKARGRLDRSPGYKLADYLAGGQAGDDGG